MRLFTLRGPVLRVPWPLVIAAWTGQALARGARWLARHPLTVAAVALVWAVVEGFRAYGWPVMVGTAGVVLMTAGVWAEARPAAFDRLVSGPARSWLRRRFVYRRHWADAMAATKLDRGDAVPALLRVTARPGLDTVRVRVLPGQILDDWRAAAPRLAAAFGARVVRVRKLPRAGLLELHVARRPEAEPDRPVPAASTAGRGAFPRAPR
jgi:S-DNA-T family DNA segregation ATPase FtsK/SpoIIIE